MTVVMESAPRHVVVRAGDLTWHILEDRRELASTGFLSKLDHALAGAKVLKDVRVKRTYVVEEGGKAYLVKMYREGGLRRMVTWFRGARAFKELEAYQAIVARDIPAAPIIAAGARPGASFVVVERLADWERGDRFYFGLQATDRRRARLAYEYGLFCRRVHENGIYQYDFNPTNVLVRWTGERPEFLLIDFERVEWMESVPLGMRLEAIGRMDRARGIPRSDRMRFLSGYSSMTGEDFDTRRMWAREITAHRDRAMREAEAKVVKACLRDGRNFGEFKHGNLVGFYRKADPETGLGGITIEALRELAVESGRARLGIHIKHAEDAKGSWQRANIDFLHGKARRTPLAVIWIRGRARGFIIYA